MSHETIRDNGLKCHQLLGILTTLLFVNNIGSLWFRQDKIGHWRTIIGQRQPKIEKNEQHQMRHKQDKVIHGQQKWYMDKAKEYNKQLKI